MPRPLDTDYSSFYANYISLTKDDNVVAVLKENFEEQLDFFKNIPIEKQEFSYAADKWTMKEMLQHIIDTERIFAFRSLVFARQDKVAIAGFDENSYALSSHANARQWSNLCEELAVVRKSSILLFESFNSEALHQTGNASNKDITVNAIGFIMTGHLLHHKNIAKERYL